MDIEKTIKNMKARRFEVSHFATGSEAAQYIAANTHNTQVGIGGSTTVKEIGLYELIKEDNEVFWHWIEPGNETCNKACAAPVYICSANGISEEGEIVNIDGRGNRLAGTCWGEKKIYIVAGTNKITPNLHTAIDRARNVAATKNISRFPYNTPCKVDGKCHDCRSADRACNGMLILFGPMFGTKVEVVLIDEELGM